MPFALKLNFVYWLFTDELVDLYYTESRYESERTEKLKISLQDFGRFLTGKKYNKNNTINSFMVATFH